jgi:hypothetical protein
MHITTDPTTISSKAFEVESLCVHSVLWATNPHPSKCLNALLSLSTYGNPKPRGPQFQQHSETLDSDQYIPSFHETTQGDSFSCKDEQQISGCKPLSSLLLYKQHSVVHSWDAMRDSTNTHSPSQMLTLSSTCS